MSEEEFVAFYAKNSGVSPQWLRDHDLIPLPCKCGEHGCRGWAMVATEMADDHKRWNAIQEGSC